MRLQHLKLLVEGAMLLSLAVFATASVQAGFIVGGAAFDEAVLSDDFTGTTLNAQWGSHISNSGWVTPGGLTAGSLHLGTSISGTSGSRYIRSTGYINYETDGGLNFGASPNDWAVEYKFRMKNATNGFEWNSPVGSGYQFSILGGYVTSDANGWSTVQGFDLRAVRNGPNWNLGWYGGDYAPGFINRPSTQGIVPEPSLQAYWLANDETYTIGLHRKADGNVDIYLTGNVYDGTGVVATYDNTLISTQPLILGANPGGLVIGDWTQSGIGGQMELDSLKIGVPVPEPSTWLLACLGLVGFGGWRRFRARR